jgi:RNA polymerase sigma-70 factor (ECF subfamily)
MSEATSATLLVDLKNKDNHEAWTRFWAIYRPFLERMLAAQGVPDFDRDDLIQEVMRVVAGAMEHFQHSGNTGAFRNWLRTTTSHRLREYWRQRDRRGQQEAEGLAVAAELEDPNSALSRAWDAQHDQVVLQQLLLLARDEFSESVFDAFRLTFIEELSLAEAAQQLGTTNNAVAISKSRVLTRIRQLASGLVEF